MSNQQQEQKPGILDSAGKTVGGAVSGVTNTVGSTVGGIGDGEWTITFH